MLAPGTQVGRYVIKRKLAEGGMAEIFLASAIGPEGFSKEVVIKIVRSFLASDSQFVQMFIAEARVSSKLNHANVVQIFDFGKHGDSYYLAMEYVRGASLWDLRKRCREHGTPFPPLLAAEIGAQVARGLQYAHNLTDNGQKLGVVHRDVTPHNVLLSFDGAVKLTDFGIAKATTQHTAPGMLKGKFAYMSPEQSRGERVDARTDIFALGIVLWELMTGGRLFDGDSDLAVLRAVQDSLIPPPSRMNPDVPQELSDVVMKALARPVEERFQSGFELERALANYVLRNAKSVEDTSVAHFLQQVFREEFEAPQVETPGSIPEDTMPDDFGNGSTVFKHRSHTAQTATPIGPVPGSGGKTEATPSRLRMKGALDDDDAPEHSTEEFVSPGGAPRPKTEQMPAHRKMTPRRFDPLPIGPPSVLEASPSVLVRPSAGQLPGTESKTLPPGPREERTVPPTGSNPAFVVREEKTSPPSSVNPAFRDHSTEESAALVRPSRAPLFIVVGVVLAGVIATGAFLNNRKSDAAVPVVSPPVAVVETPKEAPAPIVPPEPPSTPVVANDPPPALAEKHEEAAPEPSPVAPVPVPVPKETPKTASTPTRARKEMGMLNVKALPFATVTVQGKSYEVIGMKTIPAPAGTYEILLKHPKKQFKEKVTVTPNQATQVTFTAD